MVKELGKLYVAIDCKNCGLHDEGIPTDKGRLRCNDCGAYGKKAENYCAEHDINYKGKFPGDNHCPMCREQDRIRSEERHQVTRDPMVEPY